MVRRHVAQPFPDGMPHFSPETPRLTLRELDGDDIEFVIELLGDPEVMSFHPMRLTREESEEGSRARSRRSRADGPPCEPGYFFPSR